MKVDVEEAQYQAERRKEAIERAKTLLYYQTDRAKQFHVSSVFVCLSVCLSVTSPLGRAPMVIILRVSLWLNSSPASESLKCR